MNHGTSRPYWHRKRVLSWLLILGVAAVGATRLMRRDQAGAAIKLSDVERATVPPVLDGTYPCVFATLGENPTRPRLGRCIMPLEHSAAVDRIEVDLRDGSFIERQTDLLLQDVFTVPLTRTYSSRDAVDSERPHSFGPHTSHPFDLEPLGSRNPYTYLQLVLEDGDYLRFKRISSGTSYENAVYMHTDTSTRFYKATIAWNGDGWTLRMADGSRMFFPEAYNSRTVAQGAVNRWIDPSGAELHLSRDDKRRLRAIETPHGQRIQLTYDPQDRISMVEDNRANRIQYDYDRAGMLADADAASGTKRHYLYQGGLMTAISDEKGRVLVQNSYKSGRLAEQRYATGEIYRYSYEFAQNPDRIELAIVTLPDGSRETIALPNLPQDK